MYFLSLNGLIERLSRAPLTARECVHYIFAFVCLNYSSSVLSSAIPQSARETSAVTVAISFVISLIAIGIIWLVLNRFYRSNGGDEGENFLSNLLAVSFVTMFRLSVYFLPVLAIAVTIVFTKTNPLLMGITVIALVVLVIAAMFWAVESISGALKKIRANRFPSAQ